MFLPLSAACSNALVSVNPTKDLDAHVITFVGKPSSLTDAVVDSANLPSNAFISAVQSGTTGSSRITVTSNPIGRSIAVDIRIDNVSSGFWAWSLPTISWNPEVMQLTNVQEGSFLADNTGASALFIGNSPPLWNNTQGDIDGGLTEALSAASTSVDSSGVLATLTFKITNYGNSSVTIAGAYTVANFNQAGSGLCPQTTVPCYNASIAVLSNDSSLQNSPSWIIAPIVMVPVLCVLAFLLKKKTSKMCPE